MLPSKLVAETLVGRVGRILAETMVGRVGRVGRILVGRILVGSIMDGRIGMSKARATVTVAISGAMRITAPAKAKALLARFLHATTSLDEGLAKLPDRILNAMGTEVEQLASSCPCARCCALMISMVQPRNCLKESGQKFARSNGRSSSMARSAVWSPCILPSAASFGILTSIVTTVAVAVELEDVVVELGPLEVGTRRAAVHLLEVGARRATVHHQLENDDVCMCSARCCSCALRSCVRRAVASLSPLTTLHVTLYIYSHYMNSCVIIKKR